MATAAPLAGGTAPSRAMDRRAFRRHRSGWVLGALAAFLAILIAAVVWEVLERAGVIGPGRFPIFLFPGFLFALLFLFWIGWAVVRWSFRPYGGWHHAAVLYDAWGRDPAISIARQRYARGEISRDEFGALLKDLAPSEARP